MRRTISPKTGRMLLMGVVFVFFVSAIASLFWLGRGGALRYELRMDAIAKLLAFYLPLFSLMAAFYFGQRQRTNNRIDIEPFIFAAAILSTWVLTPVFLLWLADNIKEALGYIEKTKPFGDTLALSAVGYYFSKS
jgi:hypothetical protein